MVGSWDLTAACVRRQSLDQIHRAGRSRAAGRCRGRGPVLPGGEEQMRALFGLLIVAVIAIVAVGFYRGWFSLSWEKTDDNKGQVTGTVDNDKIEADKKRAIEEVKGLGSKANAHTTTAKE